MSTMKKINKEKGEHMRKTILIMTLLLAVSLTGCGTTQNKNSETTVAKSMTENDYNKAVEKLTDKSAYQTIVEDFDSDNNKEAFVLTREGKDNEAVEDEFELWFSNGDKTEKIVSDFIADNNTSITLFESGKDKYVLFNKAQTTQNDEMEAKIYGVSSEKPVELFSQSRMNIFVEKGELYTYDYTYFVLELKSKDWMSQSEQKYHLKWDNENKKCSDYKANVMSEKEFNKISNSKDVKKNIEEALKKEYSDGIKNVKYTYLTREDNTLDINMVVTDSEGTKYKNYVTVSYEDGKIGTDVELKEGNKKASVISGSSINLKTTKEVKEKLSIPNPEEITEDVNVIIHKCEYKEGQKTLYCTENEPTYDLKFLGFKNKVYITNFALGNITGENESLALVIKEKGEESDNYAYLAILDYNNKKSYVTKTDILAGQGRDEQLNLCDVTGDGKDELILSSEPNTTIDWNLYRFEDDALKQIYSNVEKQDLESEGFKTELLDDYKVKVTGNNFSQTISLLDLGVKKEDLEYKKPKDLDKSDNQNARVYKNGKLLKKYKNQSNVVEIKALMAKDWDKGFADYDYFKNVDMDEGICTPLRIALGDVEIGTLNIYLKYDKADDGLMISKVEVVDSKSVPGEED